MKICHQRSSKILLDQHQIKQRIRKQAKYSSLSTITMKISRQKGVEKQCKEISLKQNIREQKSYKFSILRICYIINFFKNQSYQDIQDIVKNVFDLIEEKLQPTINKKYGNKYQKQFLNEIQKKNLHDLSIFKQSFIKIYSQTQKVQKILQGLYDQKVVDRMIVERIKIADIMRRHLKLQRVKTQPIQIFSQSQKTDDLNTNLQVFNKLVVSDNKNLQNLMNYDLEEQISGIQRYLKTDEQFLGYQIDFNNDCNFY